MDVVWLGEEHRWSRSTASSSAGNGRNQKASGSRRSTRPRAKSWPRSPLRRRKSWATPFARRRARSRDGGRPPHLDAAKFSSRQGGSFDGKRRNLVASL